MNQGPSRVVLDASALLLFAQNPDVDPRSEIARAVIPLLGAAAEIAAPSLLAWEVGNVIFHKRANGAAEDERVDDLAQLVGDVTLHAPEASSLALTGRLALRHALTFYDAAYLELAARDGSGWLVTEDRALLLAAQQELGVERAHDLASARAAIER